MRKDGKEGGAGDELGEMEGEAWWGPGHRDKAGMQTVEDACRRCKAEMGLQVEDGHEKLGRKVGLGKKGMERR
jgi:hypothetical protein